MVRISVPSRNAPTAMNHTISFPRSPSVCSSPKRTPVVRSTTWAITTTSAVPDTSADVMNIGASSAVFQNGRATRSPKIHAVTEWTRIATGRVITAIRRRAEPDTVGRVRIHRSTAAMLR